MSVSLQAPVIRIIPEVSEDLSSQFRTHPGKWNQFTQEAQNLAKSYSAVLFRGHLFFTDARKGVKGCRVWCRKLDGSSSSAGVPPAFLKQGAQRLQVLGPCPGKPRLLLWVCVVESEATQTLIPAPSSWDPRSRQWIWHKSGQGLVIPKDLKFWSRTDGTLVVNDPLGSEESYIYEAKTRTFEPCAHPSKPLQEPGISDTNNQFLSLQPSNHSEFHNLSQFRAEGIRFCLELDMGSGELCLYDKAQSEPESLGLPAEEAGNLVFASSADKLLVVDCRWWRYLIVEWSNGHDKESWSYCAQLSQAGQVFSHRLFESDSQEPRSPVDPESGGPQFFTRFEQWLEGPFDGLPHLLELDQATAEWKSAKMEKLHQSSEFYSVYKVEHLSFNKSICFRHQDRRTED